MCDHLECHGGKLKVYKQSYQEVVAPGLLGPEWSMWEVGFLDGWFPVARAWTWREAMDAAWGWLKENSYV